MHTGFKQVYKTCLTTKKTGEAVMLRHHGAVKACWYISLRVSCLLFGAKESKGKTMEFPVCGVYSPIGTWMLLGSNNPRSSTLTSAATG